MSDYVLYTDGSCQSNPGELGGWAYVLINQDERTEEAGVIRDYVTNNIAELTAVIEGLRAVPARGVVTLYSDSSYVVNGIKAWRHNWKKHRWQGVKNAELWRTLDALVMDRDVQAIWVRGHDVCEENNRCDKMAREVYAL